MEVPEGTEHNYLIRTNSDPRGGDAIGQKSQVKTIDC